MNSIKKKLKQINIFIFYIKKTLPLNVKIKMSLLNTFNPVLSDIKVCDLFTETNININDYIVWNNDSYKVMLNIMILCFSSFTWSYFITYMSIVTSIQIKTYNDLIINMLSLFGGTFGILVYGYYNITGLNIIWMMAIMILLNLQMILSTRFQIIEYSIINAILTSFINIGGLLVLMYFMPQNITINLNINFGEDTIFKIPN